MSWMLKMAKKKTTVLILLVKNTRSMPSYSTPFTSGAVMVVLVLSPSLSTRSIAFEMSASSMRSSELMV